MSHITMIKRHLDRGSSLTALEALNNFNCLRLAARIHDIRAQGYPVEVNIIQTGKKRVARYSKDWKAVRAEFDEVIGSRR